VVEDAVELEEPTPPVERSDIALFGVAKFGVSKFGVAKFGVRGIAHAVREAPAVQHGSVVVGERALRAPVVGNGNALPRAVVAIGLREGSREIRFGRVRAPLAREADYLRNARLTAHRTPAYARPMSRPATLG